MHGRPHDFLCCSALHLLILNAGFFFLTYHSRGFVEAVVVTQVEYKYVLLRVQAGLLDLPADAVLTSVNRLILVVHDRACSHRPLIAQVTSEARDGGYDDDHPELAALLACADACINDGTADGVLDRRLLLAGSRNEKLVLDIDIVLGLGDDFLVRVLDGVLGEDAAAPVTGATHDLRMHRSLGLFRPDSIRQRRKRLLDVVAAGKLGFLHRENVVVTAFQPQPVEALIPLILVALDKVPSEDEVFGNIVDAFANHTHCDVMPWHAPGVRLG